MLERPLVLLRRGSSLEVGLDVVEGTLQDIQAVPQPTQAPRHRPAPRPRSRPMRVARQRASKARWRWLRGGSTGPCAPGCPRGRRLARTRRHREISLRCVTVTGLVARVDGQTKDAPWGAGTHVQGKEVTLLPDPCRRSSPLPLRRSPGGTAPPGDSQRTGAGPRRCGCRTRGAAGRSCRRTGRQTARAVAWSGRSTPPGRRTASPVPRRARCPGPLPRARRTFRPSSRARCRARWRPAAAALRRSPVLRRPPSGRSPRSSSPHSRRRAPALPLDSLPPPDLLYRVSGPACRGS